MLAEPAGHREEKNNPPFWNRGLQKLVSLFGNNAAATDWMDEAPEWLLDDIGADKNEKR